MKILVTGGAGFIGSHLVDRLLADDHEVVVIDNCSTGREENLAHQRSNPRLQFLRGSILNETLVAAVMPEVELVYHLAAAVGVRHVMADPLWTVITNTHGTELVLKRAYEHRRRIVFASTSEIYGQSTEVPFREDGPRVLGPTRLHRWAYSSSKAVDEHLCYAYADRGLPMSIVRYFNVYGPRMDPAGYGSVIATFVTQALDGEPVTVHGDGAQTRCFTYVEEAVDATVRAGTDEAALGDVFNVGSSFEFSVAELAAKVISVTGSRSTVTHVDPMTVYGQGFADTRRRVPEVSKIERVLGWRAVVGLDEGLASVLAERHQLNATANGVPPGRVG